MRFNLKLLLVGIGIICVALAMRQIWITKFYFPALNQPLGGVEVVLKNSRFRLGTAGERGFEKVLFESTFSDYEIGNEILALNLTHPLGYDYQSVQFYNAATNKDFAVFVWDGWVRDIEKNILFDLFLDHKKTISESRSNAIELEYFDSNNDGVVDHRWQSISSSVYISWLDTNVDGVFDTEELMGDGATFSSRRISIPVPMIKRDNADE